MSINFGPLIKKRREEIGMTQEQLAQCLHLSRQSVSQWETEERQPTVAILEKLASVLQLSLKSLVSRASQEKDDQSITYSVRLDDGEYWVDIFFEMETYDYNVYLQKRGFKDKYFLLSEDAKTITFEDLCKTITHILQ